MHPHIDMNEDAAVVAKAFAYALVGAVKENNAELCIKRLRSTVRETGRGKKQQAE